MNNKQFSNFDRLPVHLGIALALLLIPLKLSIAAEGDSHDIPNEFVDIQKVIANIALDVRYSTEDNFVGARIDGYSAGKVYLTRPTVDALKIVQGVLNDYGLGLKVFDGYRPQMAAFQFEE